MALEQICGFETGDATEGVLAGTASIQTGTVHAGTYALQVNPTTTATGTFALQRINTTTGAGINIGVGYYRFYFRYATKPSSVSEEIFATAQAICNVPFHVRIDSSGFLSAWKSNTTQIGSTGTTALSANTWYRIEVKTVSGAWEVRINGVSEISGADTGPWSAASAHFGKRTNRNGNTVDFFYDDIAIALSAYPADGQVAVLTPDGNGNYQTATIGAGSGSHWQVVDELPPNDDTDYLLSSGVVNDAETETMISTTTAGISGTVAGVKNVLRIKNNGVNGNIKARLRSGSTDSTLSSGAASTASYAGIQQFFLTDPNTSAAWTLSGVDGVEAGFIEGSTNKSRVTGIYVMVDFVPGAAPPPSASYSTLLVMGV